MLFRSDFHINGAINTRPLVTGLFHFPSFPGLASCGLCQHFIPFYGRYCPTVGIFHTLFIHLAVDGRLGSFHFLAVVSKALGNTRVYVFVWTHSFLLKEIRWGVHSVSSTLSSAGLIAFLPPSSVSQGGAAAPRAEAWRLWAWALAELVWPAGCRQ